MSVGAWVARLPADGVAVADGVTVSDESGIADWDGLSGEVVLIAVGGAVAEAGDGGLPSR